MCPFLDGHVLLVWTLYMYIFYDQHFASRYDMSLSTNTIKMLYSVDVTDPTEKASRTIQWLVAFKRSNREIIREDYDFVDSVDSHVGNFTRDLAMAVFALCHRISNFAVVKVFKTVIPLEFSLII